MSFSIRRTHLLFGNACGSRASVRISVHVSGAEALRSVVAIFCLKSSYESIAPPFRRGWSQYGLLHLGFGQTFGSRVESRRGCHS